MRQYSAKRAKVQRDRVAKLRATDADQQRCQWPTGCTDRATDAHESLGRARGGDPTDPDWLLCRTHHDQVTSASGAMLVWCYRVGLLRSAPRALVVHEPATVPDMTERQIISLRIGAAADKWVNERAKEHGVSRSVVLRAMLSVATANPRDVAAKIKAMAETA